jgi:hypothetical protein
MATFEISVNGERRFVGDDVKAITVVSDWIARRQADRVSLHVGLGGPGERGVQYLGSDLHPGDEIVIRLLEDDEPVDSDALDSCGFCGQGVSQVGSLVAGSRVAICGSCLQSFDDVVTRSEALPVGASIQQDGDRRCGFCLRGAPEVPALLVRNDAAICPECLRVCTDMTRG